MDDLDHAVDRINDRVTISDNSMAVIFKLLRIQYALCHQDELDKQDIFLMGSKEMPASNEPFSKTAGMPQTGAHTGS
jgi:hypothetical protein